VNTDSGILSEVPIRLTFTTLDENSVELDPPQFNEQMTYVYDTGPDVIRFFVTLNKPATIYYILVNGDATPPTVEQVIRGNSYAGGTVIQKGTINYPVANYNLYYWLVYLKQQTSYSIYLVAEGDSGITEVYRLDATTTPYY
jgi:hypothetical protein